MGGIAEMISLQKIITKLKSLIDKNTADITALNNSLTQLSIDKANFQVSGWSTSITFLKTNTNPVLIVTPNTIAMLWYPEGSIAVNCIATSIQENIVPTQGNGTVTLTRSEPTTWIIIAYS